MKYILTSTGITNKSLQDKLIQMVGKGFEEMAVAYIPTAINVASVQNKRWAIDNIVRLDAMKIACIDIVDFSAVPKEMWLPRLEKADVLYFEGGNPFYLMEQMQKANFIELMNTNLADKVYVGCSAGSTILGQIIIKRIKEEPGYKIGDGFSLVDFNIRPHYLDPEKANITEELIQKIAQEHEKTIYAIDDETGIAVEDGNMEIISEGKWKKFGNGK
jgi:dipeptidase E